MRHQHWPWQRIHTSFAEDCDHRERQYRQGTSSLAAAALLQNSDLQADFDFDAALVTALGVCLSSFIFLSLADSPCLFFISCQRAISALTGVSVNILVFPWRLCLPPNFLGGAAGYGLSSWGEKCWRALSLLLEVGAKLHNVSDALVVTETESALVTFVVELSTVGIWLVSVVVTDSGNVDTWLAGVAASDWSGTVPPDVAALDSEVGLSGIVALSGYDGFWVWKCRIRSVCNFCRQKIIVRKYIWIVRINACDLKARCYVVCWAVPRCRTYTSDTF